MNIKLKQLREKRGLSQAEVAQEIGISRQMYNKYERGDTEPSLSVIRSLCTLYAISYEELLGEDETSKKEKGTYSYNSKSSSGEMEVASPSVAYKSPVYGTENYYAQIVNLLPKLLLSEKSRLLTIVAQSLTDEIEGRKSQSMKVDQNNVYFPTHEEYEKGLNELIDLSNEINFRTNGIKWTREEMNER